MAPCAKVYEAVEQELQRLRGRNCMCGYEALSYPGQHETPKCLLSFDTSSSGGSIRAVHVCPRKARKI